MLAYGIPPIAVSAIAMLYKHSKSMVRSPDGGTQFFEVVTGLAPYLFILCLDYALRPYADLNADLGLTLTTARISRYPAKTITDVEYADDLALLSNIIQEFTKLLYPVENTA